MCGRYVLLTPGQIAEIKDIVAEAERRAKAAEQELRTGEISPTNRVPVLRPGEDGALHGYPMVWGYPGWPVKRKDGKGFTKPKDIINTKGETAAHSKFWHESFTMRRAIVPTTGFIEWRHKDKNDKTKYLFTTPQEPVTYLAAIWEPKQKADGSTEDHFSIVTTDANPYISQIHDRMPVVLLKPEFAQWLYGDYQALIDRCKIRLEQSLLENGTPPQQLSFI